MTPRRRGRRLGPAATLPVAALLAACGTSGPHPIPLDPKAAGALVVLSQGAESRLRHHRLEVRGPGRVRLGIQDRSFDLRHAPILHLVLSHRQERPVALRGEVTARRLVHGTRGESPADGPPFAPSTFPATVGVTFDAGPWSPSAPRHLWLDLGSVPGAAVPDALACEVRDLTIRLDGVPSPVVIEEAALHPRTPRSLTGVLRTRLACGSPMSNNLLWLIVLPPLALVTASTSVGRAVWRLPRPLTTVVLRNASLRLLRTLAAHLLTGVLVAWAVEAATRALLTAGTVRHLVHARGTLTDEDIWSRELGSMQPSTLTLVRLIRPRVPEQAGVKLVGARAAEAAPALRYLLFPRRVTREAPGGHTAYLAFADLPAVRQAEQGAWVSLAAGTTLAQSYGVAAPTSRIIGLELNLRPGSLEPDEVLVARFYSRGMARKYRGLVRTEGRPLFLLTEPVTVEGGIGLFDVTHGGGGDGRVELARSVRDNDVVGSLEGPDGTVPQELVYRLALEPPDHDLVAFTPEGASLHRLVGAAR